MCAAFFLPGFGNGRQKPLWQNKSFAVYADSIVQGNYVAATSFKFSTNDAQSGH